MSEENKTTDIKLYELSFNLVPTLSAEKASAHFESIKKILSKHKAEITKEANPELINLAYTMIKKINEKNVRFDQAYFGFVVFNATTTAVEEIKLEIDADKNVIRYLLIKTVDDFEHSTNKLPKDKREEVENESDESVEDVESIDEGVSEGEDLEDVDVVSEKKEESVEESEKKEAKKPAKKAKSKKVADVDSAIDELVK